MSSTAFQDAVTDVAASLYLPSHVARPDQAPSLRQHRRVRPLRPGQWARPARLAPLRPALVPGAKSLTLRVWSLMSLLVTVLFSMSAPVTTTAA